MSLNEVVVRIHQAFITKVEEAEFHFRKKNRISVQFPLLNGAFFFPSAWKLDARRTALKQAKAEGTILDEAQHIIKGHICIFGYWVPLPKGPEWQADPYNKDIWPKTFFNKIQESNGPGGADPKHVWEINRHQFLITLGRAYFLTSQPKYASAIASIIGDWIAHNPYNEGINWCSSLELAVRALSWIWALELCHQSEEIIDNNFRRLVGASLTEHGTHLERHLSIYSSPYNHLVGEAFGLMLIGAMLGVESWERKGWEVMASRIEEQFHPDGMSVEQATYYHHWTLGFYLLAIVFRWLNNKTVEDFVLRRVEKALECSMLMMRPDGTQPMFGDIDNARSLYAGFVHSWDFRGLLSIGAAIFGREDFKFAAGGKEEDLLWLVPDELLKQYRMLPSKKPGVTSVALPDSGYWVFRDNWTPDSNYLCFDCGPIAAGLRKDGIPSAAHGHADALSFELCAKGEPLLIDSGFYTYFGAPVWHRGFREEQAHNTIVVEGGQQAVYAGMMAWKYVKRPQVDFWDVKSNDKMVQGRIALRKDLQVCRLIKYINQTFWIVKDWIEGIKRKEKVSIWLHFDPSVTLDMTDTKSRIILARKKDAGVTIQFLDPCRLNVYRAGPMPSQGWVSKGYDMKQRAWAVQVIWNTNTTSLKWLIVPWSGHPPAIEVKDGKQGDTEIQVKINMKNYSVFMGA